MTTAAAQTVFIVDDEEPVADSIGMLLKSVGIGTRWFPDPHSFLEGYRPDMAGCLLLDVRMPRMSGLELQNELTRRRYILPVIFITGHGDVPMAVEAMRAGAVDFLQKPFNDEDLIQRVRRALEQDRRDREQLLRQEDIAKRWSELTDREHAIARMLIAGDANKVIAANLQISDRTVEVHRAKILQKMQVRNVAQLVHAVAQLDSSQGG